MKYLIDTDTASYFIRGQEPLRSRLLAASNDWGISAITYYELAKYQFSTQNLETEEAVALFLMDVLVVPFDSADALEAGRLGVVLKKAGTPIGEPDTLIAGHALSLQATLISNNTKHFSMVPELMLENWMK